MIANWPRECTAMWDKLWEYRCPAIILFGTDTEVGKYFKRYLEGFGDTLVLENKQAEILSLNGEIKNLLTSNGHLKSLNNSESLQNSNNISHVVVVASNGSEKDLLVLRNDDQEVSNFFICTFYNFFS